ncbi:MAG: hypothetical protein ACE5J4_01340 [Candidatus Aenigmatarchaeota archaeon]
MVFGIFKKYCAICGVQIEKEKNITRFGKHFCSDEHANQFIKEVEKKKARSKSSGCCG